MAAFVYDEGRKGILHGITATHSEIDLSADAIGAFFNDDGTDAPSQTADVDAADVTANNPTFANAPNLAGKSWSISSSVAVFDATDEVFTGSEALTGSTSVESFILFKDSGTNTTSPLISRHDDYTGLPLTPSGTDVTVVFAATGIIRV
jgi:hypothetical protein